VAQNIMGLIYFAFEKIEVPNGTLTIRFNQENDLSHMRKVTLWPWFDDRFLVKAKRLSF
jgi:hypothetical protein